MCGSGIGVSCRVDETHPMRVGFTHPTGVAIPLSGAKPFNSLQVRK
ncbi:hypothetical protein GGR95_001175 [Sulfitobacter undariae]|uniref:Uncharacterized protein n=1 Tax=Sulfitobacter undariae TaxID=1563671 RepID=A0A7W6H1A1_9RHOB|nr:hypothetical protein [Sulfitobacter undariae]